MLKLNKSSKEAVFVENYKIRISRSDFTHILEYLCRVSFLTTLDKYKNYFKGRHSGCKGCCTSCYMHCVTRDRNYPSSSYSL